MTESGLSRELINNIVNDLLLMPYDEALLRIGGMQISESDRKMILEIYKSRSHIQYQFENVSNYVPPKKSTEQTPKRPKYTALKVLLAFGAIALVIISVQMGLNAFAPKVSPASDTASPPYSELPTLDPALPSPSEAPTPAPSTFNHPFKTAPPNGDLINYTHEKAVVSFEITLPQTEEFYCIIMKKVSNPDAIAVSIFMNPKESYEFSVPIGTYDVYVASGTQWYGYDYLFGPDGTYGKLDSTFEFSQNDDYATGHSIELMATYNGNLDTDPMSYEDFIK